MGRRHNFFLDYLFLQFHLITWLLMPRKRSRNAQLERLLQQKQEADHKLALLENQLHQCNGFYRPPMPRPVTQQWDWNCGGCGRLVYTPKTRCICDEPQNTRPWGATLVGSIRGKQQTSTAARQATVAQASVPIARRASAAPEPSYHVRGQPLQPTNREQQQPTAPPSAAGAAQRTAPTKRASQQTGIAVAATAASRLPVGGGYASTENANAKSFTSAPASAATATEKTSEVPQSAAAVIEADNEAQRQADAIEEIDIDPDPTVPEDMGYDEIRKKLLKCEIALRKKQKRHERELKEVREMEQYIQEQQSELSLLQGKADATGSCIQEFAATIAAFSSFH